MGHFASYYKSKLSYVPFVPTDIAGCQLWLDAGQGITLNGSNVSQWADQSGNNNHAIQNIASAQPLYVADGGGDLKNKPVLDFDGIADFLEFPSGFLYNNSGITFFIIFKPTNGNNNCIFGSTNSYSTGFQITTLSYFMDLYINGVSKFKNNYLFDEYCLNTLQYGSLSTVVRHDGQLCINTTGGSALNFNGVYALGRYAGSTTYCSKFNVSEIVIYDSELPPVDVEKVEKYLIDKYLKYNKITPIMTSAINPTGIVTCSSENIIGSNGYAWKAFNYDINVGNYWQTIQPTPQWIQYQLPTPKVCTKYKIYPFGTFGIADWTFEASNDGSTWNILDIRVGQPGGGTYLISNTAGYTHYRIVITTPVTVGNIAISEITMYE